MNRLTRLGALALACLLSACAGHHLGSKKKTELTDQQYFDQGVEALKDHSYLTAIHKFEDLDSHYPVGIYAEQGQLELMYAHFMNLDYASAGATAEHFIKLYPSSRQLDYAYYVRGLSDFHADEGFFDGILPIRSAWRDIGSRETAYKDFKALLDRFPDSPFAADARQRMIFVRNQMSEHELHVAIYYARRGAYLAAANRARNTIEGYPTTPSVPEALAVLSYSYEHLGLPHLAAGARSALTLNYPGSPYIDAHGQIKLDLGARNDRRSMWNILSFGLFGSSDSPDLD